MMEKREILEKYFVGRNDTFMLKDELGWRRIQLTLDSNVLDKHVAGDWIIGSYPIYWKNKTDLREGRIRCRWICFDIDFHTEEAEANKQEIEEAIDIVISRSKQYFLCDNKYIIKEESARGFHIWIVLKEDTLLKNVDDYIDAIRPNLLRAFGDLEIFPKQTKEQVLSITGRREKGFIGNGVKLPWASNSGDLQISGIYPLDISDVVSRYRRLLSSTSYRKEIPEEKRKQTPDILRAHKKTVNKSLQKVYESQFTRPCIKSVIDGTYQCFGSNGHQMRVATANELLAMGLTPEETAKAFANQSDFDYEKSLKYCEYSARTQQAKGRDLTFHCETIESLGYCIQDCPERGVVDRKDFANKLVSLPKLKRKLPQSVKGWNGLFEKAHDLLNKPKEDAFFLVKTTRSGTTTALITQAVLEQKKILVVAPTKRIYTETIQKEVAKLVIDKKSPILLPRTYRIKSNFDSCRRLYEKFTQEEKEEIEEIFPFLLKPPCENCKYNDNCAYIKALDNLDNYDVIYITTQKLKAISQSHESSYLLNKLTDWADVIFIDECSHLFTANYTSEEIMDSNTLYDFIKECQEGLTKFYHYKQTETSKDFINEVVKFLYTISQKLKNDIIPFKEAKFVSFETTYFQSYFHDNPEAWARQFSALFRYFRKTKEKSVKTLLLAFMALSSREVYLQHIIGRNPKNYTHEHIFEPILPSDKEYYRKVYLASVNDINSLVNWLEQKSRNKLLIMTDAIEPAIDMRKIFKNLKKVNINDPNKTANKQKILRYRGKDPFHTFSKIEKKDILSLIKKEGGNGVFYVFKNKWVETLFNAINKEKNYTYTLMGEENDYYRGDKTIGVKSDLRKMIVFGSPQPPRHSYDFVADIFKKGGYLEQFSTVEEAGRYLENYNAQSTFFQAISRVKDPRGKEESIVITYGIPKMKLESYLDLEVGTPDIEEYRRQ